MMRLRMPLASSREIVRTGVVALGVSAFAAVLFYGFGVATGSRLLFTHDIGGSDLWHLNYPMKHFYAEELRAGRLPLWCPDIGTGFPLHAEGQVAALYPPNLLLYPWLPLPLAFNWSLLLHVALAGAFAAMWARQLGAARSAGVVAGVVFAFSGFFVTHQKHVNMAAAAVWIPLLLLLLERYAAGRSRRVLALFAASVGVVILAGHPQIAYNHALVAGGYAAYLALRTWRRSGRGDALRFGAGALAGAAVGLLLGAPQVLPTWELNRLGPRRGGLSLEDATRFQYRPAHLIGFVRPHAFGDPGELAREAAVDPESGEPLVDSDGRPLVRLSGFRQDRAGPILFWEMTAYAGLLPLALAAIALVVGRAHAGVRVAAGLSLLALLLALGPSGGLFHLFFRAVPGFDLFRFHGRFLVYVDLGLALLAGLGLTLGLERAASGRRAAAALAAAVAGGICFADLYAALGDHNPTIAAERWTAPPASAERILREEAGRDEPFRIAGLDPGRSVFVDAYRSARGWKGDLSPYDPAKTMLDSNLNVLYDLANLDFYYQLYPRWMGEVVSLLHTDPATGRRGGFDARVASLYNVRYLLDPSGALGGRLPLLARYPGVPRLVPARLDARTREVLYAELPAREIRLHRNPDALPRALLVPRARTSSDPAADISRAAFDPRRELLVSDAGTDAPGGAPDEPIEGALALTEYSPQRVQLRVGAARPAWLFLSDTYYPGWTARLDGVETPVRRANLAGRAVRVPAGRHEIEFRFEPGSLRLGGFAAAAGLVGLALLLRPRQGR